ncbi:MAG: hypothetical protein GY765_41920 [bacterium]|nr:hypothetical protein [bacterium]
MKKGYFPDILVIALMAVCLLVGTILLYSNIDAYKFFVDEDSIAEWLTVLGLLACSGVSTFRFFRLKKHKKKVFLIFLLLTAFVFFFGAGEELSWGQRIFNIESGTFFLEHNSQQETNVHNLIFGGLRINKLVFSLLLGFCVFIFLFLLPLFYRKSTWIRALTDRLAIPVPRLHQVLSYLLLVVVISIIDDSRKWELLEMGGALLFLAIILNPFNLAAFHIPSPCNGAPSPTDEIGRSSDNS